MPIVQNFDSECLSGQIRTKQNFHMLFGEQYFKLSSMQEAAAYTFIFHNENKIHN